MREMIFNVVVLVFLIFGFVVNLSDNFFGLGYIVALTYLSFVFIWFLKDKVQAASVILGFALVGVIVSVGLLRFNVKLFIDLFLSILLCKFLWDERQANPPKRGMWADLR